MLDGNYSKTRHIIFYRLLQRTLTRIFTGKELWAGNKETFWRQFFTPNSVIWWGLSNFLPKRRYYSIDSSNPEYSHIKFVRLRSRKEIEEFVTQLQSLKEGYISVS